MVESFALKGALPGSTGGVEEVNGAHDIGEHKGHGIGDGSVDMRLGGQVDDALEGVLGKELVEESGVGDVTPDEGIVGGVFDVGQVGQVTGVGELIEVDDVVVRVLVDEQPHDMGADKARSSSNENVFHNCCGNNLQHKLKVKQDLI